jgi:hypothetical protein
MSTRQATYARTTVTSAMVLLLALSACSSPSSGAGLDTSGVAESETAGVVSVGTEGPQGAPGIDGEPGSQGPIGQRGATGPAGPQGIPGPRGPAGPAGANGQDGASGLPAVYISTDDGFFSGDEEDLPLERIVDCIDRDDQSYNISPCASLVSLTMPEGKWLVSVSASIYVESDSGLVQSECQIWRVVGGVGALAGGGGSGFLALSDGVVQVAVTEQMTLETAANDVLEFKCEVILARPEVQEADDVDSVFVPVTLSAVAVSSIVDQSPVIE